MEANLSGPWLKRHGWDQIHSEDAIRIDDQLVPLRAGPPGGRRSHAYIKKAAVAKANSLTLVTLRAPDLGRPGQGACYLRGDERFMEKTDLHPGLNAIVELDHEGVCAAAVLNTTDHDVPIAAGTRYGIIEEASVGNQQTRGLSLIHI